MVVVPLFSHGSVLAMAVDTSRAVEEEAHGEGLERRGHESTRFEASSYR